MKLGVLAVTLLALVPSVDAAGAWAESDPEHDVSWTVAYGTANSPPAPLAPASLAYVDLVSWEIVESDASITFILGNQAGFQTQATDPSPTDRSLSHTIRFRMDGKDAVAAVELDSSMPATGVADEGIHPTAAFFCFLENEADSMCYQGGERLSFATGGGKVNIALPKPLLGGDETKPGALRDLRAYGIHDMSRQPPCCQFDSGWMDVLPDSGFAPDFTFGRSAVVNGSREPPPTTPEMPAPSAAWLFLLIATVTLVIAVTGRRGSL